MYFGKILSLDELLLWRIVSTFLQDGGGPAVEECGHWSFGALGACGLSHLCILFLETTSLGSRAWEIQAQNKLVSVWQKHHVLFDVELGADVSDATPTFVSIFLLATWPFQSQEQVRHLVCVRVAWMNFRLKDLKASTPSFASSVFQMFQFLSLQVFRCHVFILPATRPAILSRRRCLFHQSHRTMEDCETSSEARHSNLRASQDKNP